MRRPEIDRYADLKSPVHNWDPRVKLISCFTLILSFAFLNKIETALIAVAVAAALLALSRLPFCFVLRQLRWVLLFLLPLSAIIALTPPGPAEMAVFAPFRYTRVGLARAVLIFLRSLAIIMLVFPMLATTSLDQTLKALGKLGFPPQLLELLSFTYRYIFVLQEELQRMQRALAARCYRHQLHLQSLQTAGMLIGMIFVRSHGRAERLLQAMRSRGYTGSIRGQSSFLLSGSDLLKAALVIGTGVALLALNSCL